MLVVDSTPQGRIHPSAPEKAVTEDTWQARVYGSAPATAGPQRKKEWRRVSSQVFQRDNYTCQRCDKRLKAIDLGAHHLRPRADGGGDYPENLLTLCEPCHDFVEIEGFRTVPDIQGSYSDPYAYLAEREPPPSEGTWRSWVYGGARVRLPGQ